MSRLWGSGTASSPGGTCSKRGWTVRPGPEILYAPAGSPTERRLGRRNTATKGIRIACNACSWYLRTSLWGDLAGEGAGTSAPGPLSVGSGVGVNVCWQPPASAQDLYLRLRQLPMVSPNTYAYSLTDKVHGAPGAGPWVHPGALAAPVTWQTGNTELRWNLSHSTLLWPSYSRLHAPSSLTLHCNEHGACIAIHGLLGVQPQERQGGAKRRKSFEREKKGAHGRGHGARCACTACHSSELQTRVKMSTIAATRTMCPANGRPSDGTNNTHWENRSQVGR